MITPLYIAFSAIFLCGLFLNVVRLRIKNKVSLGDGEVDTLKRARSIHSNFVETVPFILLIMFALEMQGFQAPVLHSFGILMLLSRALHIWGIYGHLYAAGKPRTMSGVVTNLLFLAGAILIIIRYFIQGE